MKVLYLGLLCFTLVYLFYLIMVISNKKKMKNFLDTKQSEFLIIKYKLDKNKIKPKSFANAIAIGNSFIISITLMITELVNNYILKLLLAFVVLIPLILLIYIIIGKIYQKKVGN